MTTMIERVARAISGAPFPSQASYRKARAAIEAMREPTDAMLLAGSRAIGPDSYRSMIDAALNEQEAE